MAMTDCEACIWLKFRCREATDRLLAGDVTAENDLAAFDHVLQAVEDRKALVEELERTTPRNGWLPAYAESCRHHMQGEK